jgi:hypothetical protein
MSSYLKGIIDRAEGDFLVIKFSGDQELYWPKNSVDFNYSDGEAVNIYLSKNEPETVQKETNSKELLRQIFQTNAQT